jgi:two-component system, NtrC family, sensor kinase
MRLTTKFVFALMLATAAVLVVDGYVTVQQAVVFFEDDMRRQAELTGRGLANLVEDAWRLSGQERAIKVVEEAHADQPLMGIRWVWLDAPQGDPRAPTAPPETLRSVSQGGEVFFKSLDANGGKRLYAYVPVSVDPSRPAALELSQSLTPLNEYVRSTILRTALLAILILVLSTCLFLFLGIRMVAQPLQKLIEKTQRIGEGDLSLSQEVRGRDELAKLARALNTMCVQLAQALERVRTETDARIAATEQLRHADRLHTVGRLASGVAHEIGTPLNVISIRAGQVARGGLPPQETAECGNIIVAQVKRITTIVRGLLDFSRRRQLSRTPSSIRAIARQSSDLLEPLAKKNRISLSVVGEDFPDVAKVDADLIQQLLMNLLMNALQATHSDGHVEVGVRREHVRPPVDVGGNEGEYLCVYVRDDGAGIPEENVPHLFEPFFTTKEVGEGTGLGLSVAYGIVRDHGGWIDVASRVGEGSCFSVYLPLEDRPCPQES